MPVLVRRSETGKTPNDRAAITAPWCWTQIGSSCTRSHGANLSGTPVPCLASIRRLLNDACFAPVCVLVRVRVVELTTRTPQKCSAPQYVDHVMTWVEDQINREDIFPTTPGGQHVALSGVVASVAKRFVRGGEGLGPCDDSQRGSFFADRSMIVSSGDKMPTRYGERQKHLNKLLDPLLMCLSPMLSHPFSSYPSPSLACSMLDACWPWQTLRTRRTSRRRR